MPFRNPFDPIHEDEEQLDLANLNAIANRIPKIKPKVDGSAYTCGPGTILAIVLIVYFILMMIFCSEYELAIEARKMLGMSQSLQNILC